MGYGPAGSVHKRDQNILFTPKGGVSNAVLTAQSSLTSAIFVSSINFSIPGGALPGNLAIATISNVDPGTAFVLTPAGWNLFDVIQAAGSGFIAVYTRILQAGDTSIVFSVGNIGVSYLCTFQSYANASAIALNSKILDAAASTVVNFASVPAPLQRMQAVLLAVRNVLFIPPWLSFSSEGNLSPIFLHPQTSGSPPGFASAVCTGRMVPNVGNIGSVIGSMGNAAVYSTAVLLIR